MSFNGLLGRLRLAQGATLALLAAGLVGSSLGLPRGQSWAVAVWLGALLATAWGMFLTRRAATLQAAELEARKEAEQAAQAADRAKTTFMANMSHEIRTPMHAALGMAELLLDMDLPGEARQQVEVIQASGEALLSLIDDVLDFSKIESGKLEIANVGFDLGELTLNVARILRAQADEKGLRFLLNVASEMPGRVLGDANRLRQILLNLGGNAVKFTDEGKVELAVAMASPVAGTGDSRVVFEVRDTGIGISPQERRRVFETFVQADSSAARRAGGSGLGLSISRQLVELMGGEIGLESEHGVGSTFRVELPLPEAPPETIVAAPDDAARRRLRAAAHLLVVDDHPANRTVAVSRLEVMGYRATAAASGEEALALLARQSFDCVLMDCHMPDLDGYETTRRLRAAESEDRQSGGRRIPVIAVTADALPETRQRCLGAGMVDYLAKPFRSVELAEVVDRQLFANRGQGPLPEATIEDREPEVDAIEALRRRGRLHSAVSELLKRGEENIATLGAALESGDLATATQEAHTLGGSARMFGGEELAELCANLEVSVSECLASEAHASGDESDKATLEAPATMVVITDAWRQFTRHLRRIRDGERGQT